MSIPRLPALPVPAPRGSARPRGPARRFTATPRRLRLIAALAFAAIVLRLPACAQADKATSEALEGYFDFVDAQEAQVDRMLEIIAKVEASIDDLREHERLRGPASPARR